MPTVLRIGNLRIVIYPNDHDPPHVHLLGPDCHAKVRLGTERTRPRLLSNDGVPARALAKALLVIDENHVVLRQAWRKRNG